MIRAVVGSEPPTCPLGVFDLPLVDEVMALDRAMQEDGVALLDPDSIPYVVVQGRAHFLAALNRARNERTERKQAERDAERRAQDAIRGAGSNE